ncbi:helix-turn-helix domain-containing protein [Streptomyces erythrochromogenes]|uniref:helix-turn-helix domain-containing protein n=1 Tax=Streptomyces erythrochromogenes TaxID=285574 RepID=UPI0036CC9EC9
MRTTSTPVDTRPPLRAVRAARGLTLRDVAFRSRIDPGYLSKVERGQKQLSVEALLRLAVVLDLRELAALLRPYVLDKSASADIAPSLTNSDAAGGPAPTASSEHLTQTA